MAKLISETGIVIDACVAWLVNRLCGNRDLANRRWNQELDRLAR
jgi:hypothetical protein